MIDLHFYLDLALAFGAGGFVIVGRLPRCSGTPRGGVWSELRDAPFNGE